MFSHRFQFICEPWDFWDFFFWKWLVRNLFQVHIFIKSLNFCSTSVLLLQIKSQFVSDSLLKNIFLPFSVIGLISIVVSVKPLAFLQIPNLTIWPLWSENPTLKTQQSPVAPRDPRRHCPGNSFLLLTRLLF